MKTVALFTAAIVMCSTSMTAQAFFTSDQEAEMIEDIESYGDYLDYQYNPNAANEFAGDMIELIQQIPNRDRIEEPKEIAQAYGYESVGMSVSYGCTDDYWFYLYGPTATYVTIGDTLHADRLNIEGLWGTDCSNSSEMMRNFYYYLVDPATGETIKSFKEGENRIVVQLCYDEREFGYPGQRVLWLTVIGVEGDTYALNEAEYMAQFQ